MGTCDYTVGYENRSLLNANGLSAPLVKRISQDTTDVLLQVRILCGVLWLSRRHQDFDCESKYRGFESRQPPQSYRSGQERTLDSQSRERGFESRIGHGRTAPLLSQGRYNGRKQDAWKQHRLDGCWCPSRNRADHLDCYCSLSNKLPGSARLCQEIPEPGSLRVRTIRYVTSLPNWSSCGFESRHSLSAPLVQ